VVTENRFALGGIVQCALVSGELDLIASLVLGVHHKLLQEMTAGIEFQNGFRTSLLSDVSIAGSVEDDGFRSAVLAVAKCPKQFSSDIEFADIARAEVSGIERSCFVE